MAYNFIPAGRGRDMVDSDLTPEMREELLKLLYEKNKTSKCQVLSTAPQYARVALEQCSGGSVMVPTHFYNQTVDRGMLGLTEFIGGCGAGRFYMAIRANGNVDPCVFFPMTVGNVRKDDLATIWHKDPLFMDLRNRDMLKGNCGHCDHRFHCGGCRARANGYFDDPLETDPGCIRNIERYNELVEGSAVRETREIILSGK
jgi:radical SAM protein with 4Fe4S-binding SPASM domain